MSIANTLNLYWKYIGISIRAQMQYKVSFIMAAIGHFLITAVEFLAIWAMFDRFGSIDAWTLAEVALFYGMVHIAFSISEGAARGFDLFPSMVKSGDFDRFLLRPRSTAFQVASMEFQLLRIGRLLQAVIILGWAVTTLDISWTLPRVLLTIGAIGGGACIFSGFFVIQATLAFWTVESLEIMNTITYGGVEAASYPLAIYRDWFRRFFTFVVPLACVNYFPALAILGKPDPMGLPTVLGWLSPLLGVAFLWVTLQIWKVGVRHYTSTGS